MGFFDKFKDLIGTNDDDYDDEFTFVQSKPHDHEQEGQGFESEQSFGNNRNKVVNIHATTQLKVVLVKPERFEDASSVADHLNSKRTVVLNLEDTNKEISRRLVDFLSGVAYANNGQIKRVANSTFLITPYNVDIMSDLIDELENNGVYI